MSLKEIVICDNLEYHNYFPLPSGKYILNGDVKVGVEDIADISAINFNRTFC